MSILSLNSMQFANSLYSNAYSKSSVNYGLVKIMDSIVDQYMTSTLSNEMKMKNLSGSNISQSYSQLSLTRFPQNPAIRKLISGGLKSQQQPVPDIESVTRGTSKYEILLAINRAKLGTESDLFNNKNTSTSSLFDIFA